MRHDVSFDDHNTIRSNQFGDIYFSPDDGVAETHHVFIKGNNLPQAWQNQKNFTIAETGFGTGLNILCVWKLFEETTTPEQHLNIISVEKYPLQKSDIAKALQPFKNLFGARVDHLLQQYPLLIPGFHCVWLSDRVTLTLIFDDAASAFSQTDAYVDAWFLDGFAPSKNPDMWTEQLFNEMARLSHDNTSFATFTAAGDVKRGLQNVGFDVEKTNGFGRKRDMLTGHFTKHKKPIPNTAKRVAIIGGGLAGCATAYCLKRRGINSVIFEKNNTIGMGASSNPIALINPKLYADAKTPQTQLSQSGYSFTLKTLQNIRNIDFQSMGNIHLSHTEQKQDRFAKFKNNLHWHDDHMQILSSDDTAQKINLSCEYSSIFYPDAGMVNSQKLCHAYAQDIVIKTDHTVTIDTLSDFDVIIIANGVAANDMVELNTIPLQKIRGQVTVIETPDSAKNTPHSIGFGGYITPPYDGKMVIGSTFDHDHDMPDIIAKDNEDNLNKLATVLPDLKDHLTVIDQWAGMRCGTKDYLPVIGQLPQQDHIYTLIGLGSYGVVSSLIGAEIIASDIMQTPAPVSRDTKKALSAQRFLDRDLKRKA